MVVCQFIVAIIGTIDANLSAKVFFLWGSLCFLCLIYAYILIPETKGLSLGQVDRMLEETTSRTSPKWLPHSTYATYMGYISEKDSPPLVAADVTGAEVVHNGNGTEVVHKENNPEEINNQANPKEIQKDKLDSIV